ncbi:MAG: hypothetical protein R3287_13070 [Anderseniella sp.]|nr:hypothetical protein [Anderseniella sp.]
MDILGDLFASGRIIDGIIVLMVLETVALLALRTITNNGVSPRALLPFMAAGICLMLALRTALVDGSWMVIAGMLMLAFVFHILDIALRWDRR